MASNGKLYEKAKLRNVINKSKSCSIVIEAVGYSNGSNYLERAWGTARIYLYLPGLVHFLSSINRIAGHRPIQFIYDSKTHHVDKNPSDTTLYFP